MSRSKLAALVFLTTMTCITAPHTVVAQGATPSAAVEGFFKATADSNMKAMGRFFGTAKGPASQVNIPVDWEKRIAVMNSMLSGVQVKALGEIDSKDPNIRTVTTQLSRGACKVTLAVTTVHTSVGWIVLQFDLNQAQTVNRICDGGSSTGNTRG